MAYENIQIAYPNFCIGPQAGTFCTIDTSSLPTRLTIKTAGGSVVRNFTLSSNILTTVVALEYVGPRNVSEFYKGLTFFTTEKVSTTQCIIKRWEIDPAFSTLNLKQEILKTTAGLEYYDIVSSAIEYYNIGLYFNYPGGLPYIEVADTSKIESTMSIFVGPSTDHDNVGAFETAKVSFIFGNRVYLTGPMRYQYVAGDNVSFYKNIYLVSKLGYGNQTEKGTIYSIRILDGTTIDFISKGYYRKITTARWSQAIEGIGSIINNNMLFIRPYDYYLIWKSMDLNNADGVNDVGVAFNDVAFDDFSVYKLGKNAVYRTDSGDKIPAAWATYNFQQDTLLPYTNSVEIYSNRKYLVGQNISTDLILQVRDQFGVTLRDVNVNLYLLTGGQDLGASFSPLNGQAITDINGKATINYKSGTSYSGATTVSVKVDKSSSYTGSQYVWNKTNIFSNISKSNIGRTFSFSKPFSSFVYGFQFYNPYKNTHFKRRENPDKYVLTNYDFSSWAETEVAVPCMYLITKTFFSSLAGDGDYVGGGWLQDFAPWYYPEYWPLYQIGTVSGSFSGRGDGPPFNMKTPWARDTTADGVIDPLNLSGFALRSNFILQLSNFTQKPDPSNILLPYKALKLPQPLNYLIYSRGGVQIKNYGGLEDGLPPWTYISAKVKDYYLQISQLKMSGHDYVVDGVHYTDLFSRVKIDQFIFVEDAVPKFWSEKNPRETYIWLRLRPFAFDLNGLTLKVWVREIWTSDDIVHDTGYYRVDQWANINYFNAGGNILGIEFLYQPEEIFHNDALVYVHLEVYDTSGIPNFIYLDYWFKVIPDYKSPYLLNMNPDREQDQVPVDTNIYFEIKDDGAGIDIETLDVYINSRILVPTNIECVTKSYYKIMCDIPQDLFFDKEYYINVVVRDLSPARNTLRDRYRFYTVDSSAPEFTDFDPKLCLRGMSRFRDVSFTVLSTGQGVDKETLRIQVADKDVTDDSTIVPIIYRIS
jgi:hypothetical protein